MSTANSSKWPSAEVVARALGGVRQNGDHWLAPCPVPTHGKGHGDRNPSLSLRDGSRSGQVLVHCFAGCSNEDVVAALRARGLWCDSLRGQTTGLAVPSQEKGPGWAIEATRRTGLALKIWRASLDAHGTLVETYLRSRGITYPPPPTLRFHPALWHSPSRLKWPAMVALVTHGIDNTPLGIHRTFLAHDGKGKAPVQPGKMMLGPTRGGAVRLAAATDVLHVGEGIETCLSALQATGDPTWAALSTSGLRTLALPDTVREVIILADGDDPGEAAARHAARRWHREGRGVRIARPTRGFDFNDLLVGRAPA